MLSLDFDGISDGRSNALVPSATAYFPLDENPGSTEAADVLSGHVGTIVAVGDSPRFVADGGHRGGALVFARGQGALTIASLSQAMFPRRASLAIWTRAISQLPADRRLVFAARDARGQQGIANALELSIEVDRFVWTTTGSDTSSFVDGVVAEKWFLVVAMWDVGTQRRALYVREEGGRNSLVESALLTSDADLADVTFELEHPSGALDEVRLFDHVLTRAELDAIQ